MIWVPDFRLAEALGAREASALEHALQALIVKSRETSGGATGVVHSHS